MVPVLIKQGLEPSVAHEIWNSLRTGKEFQIMAKTMKIEFTEEEAEYVWHCLNWPPHKRKCEYTRIEKFDCLREKIQTNVFSKFDDIKSQVFKSPQSPSGYDITPEKDAVHIGCKDFSRKEIQKTIDAIITVNDASKLFFKMGKFQIQLKVTLGSRDCHVYSDHIMRHGVKITKEDLELWLSLCL